MSTVHSTHCPLLPLKAESGDDTVDVGGDPEVGARSGENETGKEEKPACGSISEAAAMSDRGSNQLGPPRIISPKGRKLELPTS